MMMVCVKYEILISRKKDYSIGFLNENERKRKRNIRKNREKRSFIKFLGRGTSDLGGSCALKNKRSFNLTL